MGPGWIDPHPARYCHGGAAGRFREYIQRKEVPEMSALTWAKLVEEADQIDDKDYPSREWTPEEREEWQDWINVWNDPSGNSTDRGVAIRVAERLEEIFDEGRPYKSLTGLYIWVYESVVSECVAFGPAVKAPYPFLTAEPRETNAQPEDTAKEPPFYVEDDFIIDWTQPVIFRGESRNGDGRLFYLHVPWDIVPGNQLRSFLKENVGVAKGYKGMNGFKLGGEKYFRTLPLAGQVNKKPVSYIDRTIEALLANGAESVQERRVINTESLCTGSCQDANSWTPCECICGGDGHGGGSVLPGADYTIYKGDLIIEGKRQTVWKVYG